MRCAGVLPEVGTFLLSLERISEFTDFVHKGFSTNHGADLIISGMKGTSNFIGPSNGSGIGPTACHPRSRRNLSNSFVLRRSWSIASKSQILPSVLGARIPQSTNRPEFQDSPTGDCQHECLSLLPCARSMRYMLVTKQES